MQNATALQPDTCLSLCSTLEGLLLDSMGPNGLHTMVMTSSGNTLISGDGYTVVTSLMLSHPIGRWIVDHMKAHHGRTGDNAKSFILILTEILRHILPKEGGSVTNSSRQELTELSHGLAELHSAILPDVLLPQLIKHAVPLNVTPKNKQAIKDICLNIIRTSFAGKFNPQGTKHMSALLCNLILDCCSKLEQLDKTVQLLLDNFERRFLEVPNEPVTSSKVTSGIIISRDFTHKASDLNSLTSIKFILVGTSFEKLTPGSISSLQISSQYQMQHVLNFKSNHLQTFAQCARSKGVNLVVSAELLSEAALHECRLADISVIHMVPEEEIADIAQLVPIQVLHGPDDVIVESTIGTADFCQSILVANSKYVNLGIDTKQLLVCSPTKGICRQWYTALHNALKCLLMWLSVEHLTDHKDMKISAGHSQNTDSDLSNANHTILHERTEETGRMIATPLQHLQGLCIQGGGAADILTSKILAEYSLRPSMSLAASKACKLLAEAVLCIPRTLYANSFVAKTAKTTFIHVQNQIETELCASGRLQGVDGKTGKACDLYKQGVVEPVFAKYLLLSDVVRTAQELLRIDTVVGVKGSIKEISLSVL